MFFHRETHTLTEIEKFNIIIKVCFIRQFCSFPQNCRHNTYCRGLGGNESHQDSFHTAIQSHQAVLSIYCSETVYVDLMNERKGHMQSLQWNENVSSLNQHSLHKLHLWAGLVHKNYMLNLT